MSVPARRVVKRLRKMVQGENPDPLAPTFTTAAGVALDDIDDWDPRARFRRPNGTTIDVTTGISIVEGTVVVPFPELDETGTWYAEVWVTNGTLEYASDLYVFDVGDPLEASPGDPPPPGDHFVTDLELEALVGLPAGLLPEGPPDDGDVPIWDEGAGMVVWGPQSGGGPGGGQVDDIGEGHAIAVSGTASHPIVSVDESALDVVADLAAELVARAAADTALATSVTNEATARATAVSTEAASRAAADLLLIPLTQKGAASGVATLDGGGKVPSSQLPSIAVTDTFVVANQAAMLAVSGADVGDIAIRTDGAGTFILTATPAATLGNWQLLRAPTDAVTSVEGRTGAVSVADLYDAAGLAAAAQAFAIQRTNHSGTQAIATIAGLQAALDAKAADTAVVHNTGAETVAGVKTFSAAPSVPDGSWTIAKTTGLQAALDAEAAARAAADTLLAPVSSPAFTGNPTAPTPATTDNDTSIATTAMVQAAIAAYVAAQDVEVFKGVIDCSTNPNYPAADAGWTYRVSVAGKIGGASGPNVEAGDSLLCLVDGTVSGNQATVGTAWSIGQTNIDGAVVGPTVATDGHLPQFDGTSGKLLKDGLAVDTDGTLAANSDTRVATQKAVRTFALSRVVQTITDGNTTTAPSEDAVHDALTAKADVSALGTAAALNSGTSSGNLPTVAQADARYAALLKATATKTASYSANAWEQVLLDTSSGTPIVVTLPTAPADGTVVEAGWILGGNPTATVVTGGSDTFQGGGTTSTLLYLYQFRRYTYRTSGALWTVQNSMAISGLDARYQQNAPRVTTVVSNATPTFNTDTMDLLSITALAAAITSMVTNKTGTPTNGQQMRWRIKDDGTARAITVGADYVTKCSFAIPTTTVAGKQMELGWEWDSVLSKWCLLALAQEV